MKNVVLVVDLQFGSTGKGQIAGTLGRQWQPDTVVCANGPNAGHTYKWWEGDDPYTLRQVMHTVMPVTAVLPSVRNILLGPGAVIDMDRLEAEIRQNREYFVNRRLIIHPNAAIVTAEHRERESTLIGIGSTMKGTAEAVIAKMRRLEGADIARNWATHLEGNTIIGQSFRTVVDEQAYNDALDSSQKLLVEGAQGSSLSMHSRFYPHCTSRDVSVHQIWADCRLPAAAAGDVSIVGVCRTFPIRVANRFDASGRQIGHSGGCYPDQKEITWESIGQTAELTTVTRLPRRLFTFSTLQILEAARYNAPTSIALTFCDYLPSHSPTFPNIAPDPFPVGEGAQVSPCVQRLISRIEAAASCNVDFVSFGATDHDIFSPDSGRLQKLFMPWGVT